jgi:hypothetical protein
MAFRQAGAEPTMAILLSAFSTTVLNRIWSNSRHPNSFLFRRDSSFGGQVIDHAGQMLACR